MYLGCILRFSLIFKFCNSNNYSTETALLKVKNDILKAMQKKQGVLKVLLDLLAAFDTACHSRLLAVLEEPTDLHGIAIRWFQSYLSGRTQLVALRDADTAETALDHGVPQGSVLGPMLFSIYALIRRHGLDASFYQF